MTSYFSLPLEIRQQILFEAFAQAYEQDAYSLWPIGRLFSSIKGNASSIAFTYLHTLV